MSDVPVQQWSLQQNQDWRPLQGYLLQCTLGLVQDLSPWSFDLEDALRIEIFTDGNGGAPSVFPAWACCVRVVSRDGVMHFLDKPGLVVC
eukprot:8461867-Pyramimonas_sp.AAC.1